MVLCQSWSETSRVAQDQYDVMTHIDLKDAKPGDLIFFHSTYDAGTYVTHVGIYAERIACFTQKSSGLDESYRKLLAADLIEPADTIKRKEEK